VWFLRGGRILSLKSFDECLSMVEGLVPSILKNNEEYRVLLKILAYSLMRNYEGIDRIDKAYDVDFVDDRDLPKLADTMNIQYPIGSDSDTLRGILKYFKKILKNRGSVDSIKQMVRVLENSEEDLYNISLEDYSDVDVRLSYDGLIVVSYDGIEDFDYTYDMLLRVVPAGYRLELSNLDGPITKGFDIIYSEEIYNVAFEGHFDEVFSSDSSHIDMYVYGKDEVSVSDLSFIEARIEVYEIFYWDFDSDVGLGEVEKYGSDDGLFEDLGIASLKPLTWDEVVLSWDDLDIPWDSI